MATKEMIALKDFRYGTRMLRAGEPVAMDSPDVRLFTALGAVAPNTGIRKVPLEAAPKAPRQRKPRAKK